MGFCRHLWVLPVFVFLHVLFLYDLVSFFFHFRCVTVHNYLFLHLCVSTGVCCVCVFVFLKSCFYCIFFYVSTNEFLRVWEFCPCVSYTSLCICVILCGSCFFLTCSCISAPVCFYMFWYLSKCSFSYVCVFLHVLCNNSARACFYIFFVSQVCFCFSCFLRFCRWVCFFTCVFFFEHWVVWRTFFFSFEKTW